MTTLPERLKELASRMNQDGDKYDAFTLLAEAVQALQAQEVVKETTINHARDPHCCGCYVIRWNDGDPVAVCGECGLQVALLDRLVAQEGGALVPIAWAVETEHYGRGYSFSNEFIETFPNAPVSFGNLYLVAAPSPTAALQAGET